ncbi:ribonuclease HII [Niabella drilacis]|uniref:Ribonuclease HII n=1 Tax=Niabella drilacis (strain DSM 25811 / CCM 8410 / CCUG 62505 / LMG 26954 / E90) TaxID=1285928 RepID=A0A1G6Q3C8_NIADE|nr:ribonuclease HII [Niabella drilacis]SDC86266.1 RNase HII [Niabella drilacis]
MTKKTRSNPPRLLLACQQDLLEAGCDEAGRGCYAGPVFAAAVILPEGFYHPLLNDSKQISAEIRTELRYYIEANALTYAVAQVSVEEIDATNILKASQRAMHLALDALTPAADFIAVDGNYFVPYRQVPHTCIIKGDGKYAHIAAASILAKTYRDAYMQRIHEEFPHYNWISNKGYGTMKHRMAIEENGICRHHRKSFNILPGSLQPSED